MGFRDVIAHQYFDLDTEQVLVICQEALSGLLEAIRCLEQAARKDPCPMTKAEASVEELVRTIDYDELQERNGSGVLFFWQAGDALDFQGQLQACGAITGRRKLPWRYRWPDAVRDDVLARLLALNAERYEEEVNLGLHSKGAKQAARAAAEDSAP
jgi:hypothetical protein